MNLNITKDDSNLNDFIYCWDIFKTRPNKIKLHNSYLSNEFENSLKIKEENVFTDIIPNGEEYIVNDKVFCKINDNIFLSYNKNSENSLINNVIVYYKSKLDIDKVEELINNFEKFAIEQININDSNLHTVSISKGGLEIISLDRGEKNLENINLFYNEETIKSVRKSIKILEKENSGIAILYGERGTGKTNIIDLYIQSLDKKFIYIPSNMIENTISNPEFMDIVRNIENPVIILDDCEFTFNSLYDRSNLISSIILQYIEGIDKIDINFIMIFNGIYSEIDSNFLESNSLISSVEFNYLSIDEANKLSKHLNNKTKYKNKVKVSDIKRNRKNIQNKIGF